MTTSGRQVRKASLPTPTFSCFSQRGARSQPHTACSVRNDSLLTALRFTGFTVALVGRDVDIWPSHKWVVVESDKPIDWLRAITDRGVDILLVPDRSSVDDVGETGPSALFSSNSDDDPHVKLALHAAQRLIRECWVYSPSGRVRGGDVSVRFSPGGAGAEKDLVGWVRSLSFTSNEPMV